MEDIIAYLKAAGLLAGVVLSKIFGGWDTALITLVCLVILDTITGALASEYGLSSARARIGLKKKAAYLLAVIFGVVIDFSTGTGQTTVRDGIVVAVSIPEALSIVENFGRLGVPLPKFLKKYFEALKESKEDNANDKT
jgi:toxin secretion/phage lysis holin